MVATHDSTTPVWYPANPAQRGLWVLDRVEQLRLTSLIPTIMRISGLVDHALLVSSVQRVLERHPSLRSRFRLNAARKRVEYRTDGEPAEAGFIDAVADGWSPEELDRLLDALCYTGFELGDEPPVRAEVIRVDAETALLVFTVHHIVCDGWSRTLLMAEIAEVYRAAVAGVEPALSSPPHPSEVITMLGADEAAERLPAILERLRGAPMDVEMPFRRDTDNTSLSGASVSTHFDEKLTAALLAAAGQEGCTPFMTAVALLAGTLARTGGQRDFLFAFGWPGRDDPAVAEAIGMFMNTVVLRVSLDDTTTWRELLRHTRIAAMEAFVDGDVPLDAVTAGLRPNREVIWPPLSPVLVNMTEVPAPMELAPGVVGRLDPLPGLHMKYDLGLFVCLDGEAAGRRLELSVDYVEATYDRAAVAGFLEDLRAAATDLAHSLEDIVTEQAKIDLSTPETRIGFVRSLWQEVLGTDEIGEDVGFFDAGGDSLLLVVLVERMSQASGRLIKTMELFRAGTVRGHAELLAVRQDGSSSPSAGGSSRDRLLSTVRASAKRDD